MSLQAAAYEEDSDTNKKMKVGNGRNGRGGDEIDLLKELLSSSSSFSSLSPAKQKQLLQPSDNDEVEDEDSDIEEDGDHYDDQDNESEMDMEEAAREIFNELAGGPQASSLPLSAFLSWEEVQDLINSGALTKEDLVAAIQAVGVDGSKPDSASLSFAQVIYALYNHIIPCQ